VVVVVSAPAELRKKFGIRVSNDSKRTHYNVPRSQAISSRESAFRSEFFISDAPTLGLSDPFAWNTSLSGESCWKNEAY